MSEPAPPDRFEGTDRRHVPTAATLTPAAIDAILSEFRNWLADAATASPPAPVAEAAAPVDLFTLVGQFAALRHEVNLQTKAARAAVDQNAEVLKQLAAAPAPAANDDEALRPVAKAIVDIADALGLSLRQMEKFRDTVEELLAAPATPEAAPPAPGFFARLFGAKPAAAAALPHEKLRPLAASAADGYALSLRRIERLLPTLELEPLECVGAAFDPEFMEVVEVLGDTGEESGTVVEEIRTGYLWRGRILRFAQVKVAR